MTGGIKQGLPKMYTNANSLDLIQQFYPKTFRIDTDQLAILIGLGSQTVRNKTSKNTLRIKSMKDGARRLFDIRDVAAFLDEQRDQSNTTQTTPPLRKVGRPTKASQMANAAAKSGVSAWARPN